MKKIVGSLLIIIAGIYALYLGFSQPDATKTRLFLDHWQEYLACIVILMIGKGLTE